MRAFLATMKPVLPLVMGLLLPAALLPLAAAIAGAYPYPVEKPAGWSKPARLDPPPVIDFSFVEELQAQEREQQLASAGPAPKITVTTVPVESRIVPELDFSAPAVEPPKPADPAAEARAYLVATAFPGGTMTMLGRERSIACFDPRFAINLAAAVKDGREHGFPNVGVLSGCRPPRLGIGGFRDKRNSLHSVGLAADMANIGAPCSAQARRWHAIANRHGVATVYSSCNRAEWNHMQGTRIRMTTPALRATITRRGDIAPDLASLWRVTQKVALAVAQPLMTLVHVAQADPPAARPAIKKHRTAHRHRVKHRHVAKRHHVRKHRAARRHKVKRRQVAQADPWAWQQKQRWETWR